MNIETAARVGDIRAFAELFNKEHGAARDLLKIAIEARQQVISRFLQMHMREHGQGDQCERILQQAKALEKYRKKRPQPRLESKYGDEDTELTTEIEAEHQRSASITSKYRQDIRRLQITSVFFAVFFMLLAVADVWLPR